MNDKTGTFIDWLVIVAFIVVMMSFFSKKAKADHNDVVHATAHVGVAYMGTMIGYGIGSLLLGKEAREFSLITSAVVVLVAGAIYDAQQPKKGSSFMRNAAGVGVATGSVVLFDF